jgi:carbamoyltransferase
VRDRVAQECGFDLDQCRFETHEIEHHLAHVASSFYCSGFKEAAALSYDASGDFVSTMFALCMGPFLIPK